MTRPTDGSLQKASALLAEIRHEFRHGTKFKWAIARLLDESSQRHVVDHLIPYVGARADQEARAIQAEAALTTELAAKDAALAEARQVIDQMRAPAIVWAATYAERFGLDATHPAHQETLDRAAAWLERNSQ